MHRPSIRFVWSPCHGVGDPPGGPKRRYRPRVSRGRFHEPFVPLRVSFSAQRHIQGISSAFRSQACTGWTTRHPQHSSKRQFVHMVVTESSAIGFAEHVVKTPSFVLADGVRCAFAQSLVPADRAVLRSGTTTGGFQSACPPGCVCPSMVGSPAVMDGSQARLTWSNCAARVVRTRRSDPGRLRTCSFRSYAHSRPSR